MFRFEILNVEVFRENPLKETIEEEINTKRKKYSEAIALYSFVKSANSLLFSHFFNQT